MKDYSLNHSRVLLTEFNGRKSFKCPLCGRPLIVDDGKKWKLKTRIVIFLQKKTLAKCKYCKNDIEVPVRFDLKTAINDFKEDRKGLSIEPEQS